jgi:hypothetical protein
VKILVIVHCLNIQTWFPIFSGTFDTTKTKSDINSLIYIQMYLFYFVGYFTTLLYKLHGIWWWDVSELEKDLARSRHGLTVVIFWHLPGGTEQNHEKLQSGELEPQPRFKPSVFWMHVYSITAIWTHLVHVSTEIPIVGL